MVDTSERREYRLHVAGLEGTGLGLSIVRALIALHGGELELVSAVGEGTTATLVFPASRAVDAAERRREA